MSVETNYNGVDDLNPSWPTTAADPVSEGADHLRGIKKVLQAAVGGNGTRADIKYAGAVVLRSLAKGLAWLSGGVEKARVYLGGAGDAELIVEPSANDGAVRVFGRTSAGAATVAALLGAVQQALYAAGVSVFETRASGAAVRGASDPALLFETTAGVARGSVTGSSAGVSVASPTGTVVSLGPSGSTAVQVSATTITANRRISTVTDPASAQDAATKAYVDAQFLGGKILARGLLTPPGTSKVAGCTAAKGAVGLWTLTLTTAATGVGNVVVLATCGGGTAVATETGLASYAVVSTTSVQIWTREVNNDATFIDAPVSFIVLDVGP